MKIGSGNKDFDEWLNGGYESDVITTFYGPAGSGKTNLCILAVAEQARQGKKVLFIDTEGGFSMERLKQIIPEKFFSNIIVLKATDFYEQQRILNRLSRGIGKDVCLIVVDSIIMHYRLELGLAKEKSPDEMRIINRMLVKQLKILNELSRRFEIPILITDQVYSTFTKDISDEKQVHMAGGDIIKYWSKCIIELRRKSNKRKAILRKHRSLPEKEFSFYINDKGIEKSGWLF